MIEFKIADVLAQRGLAQREVGRITGIHKNTINALYHGKLKLIDTDYIDKLCKVLECQVGDLMEYVPDED